MEVVAEVLVVVAAVVVAEIKYILSQPGVFADGVARGLVEQRREFLIP